MNNIHTMIELRDLQLLRQLRELGSLSAVGLALQLSQSAISHHLRDLEQRLGSPLVHRRVKPLRFTAIGRRLLQSAEIITAEMQECERDISALLHHDQQRCHIALECHSCFEWLIPSIERFRLQWPEIDLDIRTHMSFDPLPSLADGIVDMVVATDRSSRPDITFTALGSYEMVLIVSPKHPLAKRKFARPQDLRDECLITYPVETCRLDIYNQFLEPAGINPQRRQCELTMMIIQLVAGGRGLAALPRWALGNAEQRGIVQTLPLGSKGIHSELLLAYRSEDQDQQHVQDFIGAATVCVRELGILN